MNKERKSQMKFSFNATTLREFEFSEAVNLISKAGYDGVEIALNDKHLHPRKSTIENVYEAKRLCADLGLEIVCIAAGGPHVFGETPYEPSIISADEKGRQARLDLNRKSIELTHMIGCPVININSGLPVEGLSPERAWEYLLEAINSLIPELGNIVMAFEPEPNFFVGTTTKAIEMINEINSPKVRLNLDIGHVFCSEDD
jgi:sugar phosphate isomerase/epimerase